MQRLHLHVNVPSIKDAISFYSTLFDAPLLITVES